MRIASVAILLRRPGASKTSVTDAPEGIAAAEACDLLTRLGRTKGQDDDMARPMPVADFETWLERGQPRFNRRA